MNILQLRNNAVRIAGSLLLAGWLAGCASSEPYRYGGNSDDAAISETGTATAEPGTAASQGSREEAEAARRQAEAAEAEEARRREALARQQEQARAEEQQRLARQRARQQVEREVAEQRERITALQSRIDATDAETGQLDAANAILQEALAAAEALNRALSEEQDKYEDVDPETGELATPLDEDGIATLRAEKERLEVEAQALMPDSAAGE